MKVRIPRDDDVSNMIDVLGWVAHWLYWGGLDGTDQELGAYVRNHMGYNDIYHWDSSVGDYV